LQLPNQEVFFMKRALLVTLCIVALVGFAMAQNPTYTGGAVGITGIDKLGAHQNGGRGCQGCHIPHSGARGNGGNAATGGGAVTDPNTGSYALWGQDLGPLYNQVLAFGDEGGYPITLPANSLADESVTTGVMMCLSCHDGNLAKGAMMTNQSYEQSAHLLPSSYGPQPIPTLLGNDGTAAGNYENDHPIGPKATLGALGQDSHFVYDTTSCVSHGVANPCLQVKSTDTAYLLFQSHYGSFQVTQSTTAQPAGARAQPLILPTTNVADAYVVCTTCHTPHSMYVFSGTAGGTKGTYPTYFFIAAPYNPGASIPDGTKASSATQFCRQCHYSGAGGSNEGSSINNVTTKF
jgi:hypothetical protein